MMQLEMCRVWLLTVFLFDAAAATGIYAGDNAVAFVMYDAAATGIGLKVFVDGDVYNAAAAGINAAGIYRSG